MRKFEKIITHIPHSSIQNFQEGWIGGFNMFPLVKAYTDWHTQLLFGSDNKKVIPMVYPNSRFYLDVERLLVDPLEKIGQGRIYTSFNGFERYVDSDTATKLKHEYCDWWMACNELADNDDTLVIDCHAFTNSIAPDVDVCIGFNEDQSHPGDDVLGFIARQFEDIGFKKIAFNKPYSNSITFNKSHKSVMIELNKSIYMDEDTLDLNISSYRIKLAIEQIYSKLTEG